MRIIGGKEVKISIKEDGEQRRNRRDRRGRINIVGIGPGDIAQMSLKAHMAIAKSDCIVGYSTYIKLLGRMTAGKEIVSSGMRQEVERAEKAIEIALRGKIVSVISSGDPGVYGMAGILLEILKPVQKKALDVEVIPGIISAAACASLLGAPLANDFAAVSLSDLLTDWKEIECRLKASARSGFVIVLYNPKSLMRIKPLVKALAIIREHRAPTTPVGIVKNAYRSGQSVKIVRLKDLRKMDDIDMVTTIIIGNGNTYIKNGYMITPRGYNIPMSSPRTRGSDTLFGCPLSRA